MDLRGRLRRLRRAARMARSGARIFKNAGFSETMGLGHVLALAKTARDARRGIKGGAAIIHLHALTDPLRAGARRRRLRAPTTASSRSASIA